MQNKKRKLLICKTIKMNKLDQKYEMIEDMEHDLDEYESSGLCEL